MSAVLAILGLLWTIFTFVLWVIQISSLYMTVRYGAPLQPETLSGRLWGIGINGTGILLFALAIFPYVKPLIQIGLRWALTALGGGAAVSAVDAALDVASSTIQSATGQVVATGKKIVAEVSEHLPSGANAILPAPAPAMPNKVELVISQPLQVVLAQPPSPPPAPAAKPAAPATPAAPETAK